MMAILIAVSCEVEADRGECKETIPRFFFNPRKGVCEPFIYGGCGGNGNNFESLEECLQQCNPNGLFRIIVVSEQLYVLIN